MVIAINTKALLPGKMEGYGYYIEEIFSRIAIRHPEHPPAMVHVEHFQRAAVLGPGKGQHEGKQIGADQRQQAALFAGQDKGKLLPLEQRARGRQPLLAVAQVVGQDVNLLDVA